LRRLRQRRPDVRTFENTRWRVVAINGQATPATGDYLVTFKAQDIGGRFGCNHFGGRYALAGETIVVREVASTLMGCPEPAATFESAGLRVLAAPMRWTWVAEQKLL
jgi:heat shock protein HslJ